MKKVREKLKREEAARQAQYWESALKTDPSIITIPTDFPRRPVSVFHRDQVSMLAGDMRTIEEFCFGSNSSLFSVLLTSYWALIVRYTGEQELAVGSISSDSIWIDFVESQSVFVNPIAIRGNVSSSMTAWEAIRHSITVIAAAAENRDYPFELLAKRFAGNRILSRAPIFQTMLILLDEPWCPNVKPNHMRDVHSVNHEIVQRELVLLVSREKDQLRVTADYDSDLFRRETIERLLHNMETVLNGIIAWPDTRVDELPILSSKEKKDVLLNWSGKQVDRSRNMLLHEMVERHVHERPDVVAIVFEDQEVTYEELNKRANRLARYMQRRGVKPEVRVGICLQQSIDMIVAVLAVLKAGGAYVPLDSSYPSKRLSFLIDDANLSIVLTEQGACRNLPQAPQLVFLDSSALITESSENLSVTVNTMDLSYVIYTSGSTGRPKGVMITHENAIASTTARFFHYGKTPPIFLLSPKLTFDSSVAGIFWTLGLGGCLVIPKELESAILVDVIFKRNISHLLCVPVLYKLILDELRSKSWTPLKAVIVAGDVLKRELVEEHYEVAPNVQLINEYGPTEGTVWSTLHRCKRRETVDRIPIGKPIRNTRIFLLDEKMAPVPIGAIGELCIGGKMVSRGYINQADLTAEKFVPNPFPMKPGERLYRTGDICRWLHDGRIEFVERIDDQVKLHGYRIELGEIETMLKEHPNIRDVVITTREDNTGRKRLVAYYVANEILPQIEGELAKFLEKRLPNYMMPSFYIAIESFPLNANGKLDRRALPEPDAENSDKCNRPQTHIEQVLAEIWSEVLGLKQLDIHDDFFALGGDSVAAMRVVSRVRKVLSAQVSMRDIIEKSTIARLATALVEATKP